MTERRARSLDIDSLLVRVKDAARLLHEPASSRSSDSAFRLSELLKYQGDPFIAAAYRSALGRVPDSGGFEHYKRLIDEKNFPREFVLGLLRYSKEGRRRGAVIRGLIPGVLLQMLYRIPVLGYLLKTLLSILRLPHHVETLRSLEWRNRNYASVSQLRMAEREFEQAKTAIRRLQDRVETTPRELSELSSDESRHRLDSLYVEFENRFRGSRDEIKQKLSCYLPIVARVVKNTSGGAIDVGCGRCEWLELMEERGIPAQGLDLNRVFVENFRDRFKVIEADAVSHLSSLDAESQAIITGFHIIEHLSLDQLLSLIDESLRVLEPGGVAIFETPNPSNVLVGSHDFHHDPTHNKPIPSQVAKFLMACRGFSGVSIMNLHPYPEELKLEGDELASRFNEYFYGARDYAVIAYKQA